ncbi:hypothetical protein KR059_005038, partial [Drosophila kikkawai]
KSLIFLAFLILGFCVSVQAQTPEPDLRDVCRRQNRRCLSRENLNGRTNEVTTIFNDHCRTTNRNWRNVTRCELAQANCQLTLVRCSTLTCANVRRTLGGGGGGGGGGRTTTRRSPMDPVENPEPDTSTRRNPPRRTSRPRTTRRPGRTTTRRTQTTRRSGRTTTRRTPTTRRSRRTTTRRTPTTRRSGRTTTRRTPTTR